MSPPNVARQIFSGVYSTAFGSGSRREGVVCD